MAIRLTRSCDFKPGGSRPAPADHDADITIELKVEGTTYKMDICHEHAKDMAELNMARGFTPAIMVVGHNRRGAYLTKSGRPFTTKQAREWLQAQGYDVAEVGRLTGEQLDAYADAH